MNLIVAGNWKMNMTLDEGQDFFDGLTSFLQNSDKCKSEIIVGVPFIHLFEANRLKNSGINFSAQNCSEHISGAFTGEVSASMIKSTGTDYVIVGHSERRQYYGDTDAVVNTKIKQALEHGLKAIFCVGELLEERKANQQMQVVNQQIEKGLEGLTADDLKNVVIAYEPVWAIGTGETASPEQAEEMHASIRKRLVELYNDKVANATPILYGGSVKPANAKEIFSQPNVNGGLIGGASLKLDSYTELIKIAEELSA